jgi:peptide/nickel transport system substrate-binding protein
MRHRRYPMLRHLRYRRTAAVVTAASLALLAAACGSSGASGSGSGSASSSTVTLTVEASPTGPIADTFNPLLSTSPAVLLGAESMVYEPLLQYNLSDANAAPMPWLATSYAFSNDDKTLTFQLRHGVTWSDGKPFSSADVAFTFDMLKQYPGVNTQDIVVASVQTPNAYEVVLNFTSPQYVNLYSIAGDTPIVPQHIWSTVGNPANYADAKPVGTGPYLVKSITTLGVDMTRNPHYWQPGEPKVANLDYPVFDSNTSANLALENGEIDWAGNFVPHITQVYSSQDPSHRFYAFPPFRTAYMIMNMHDYPFGDLKVRQAMSMALDRPSVINAGEYGEQPAALSPTGLILPQQASALDPQYTGDNYGAANLTSARALLESDGFTDRGGKLYEPNGQPFAFTIVGPSAYTDVMADFQVVADQWRQLGATVTLSGEAVNSWIQQEETGDYQVTAGGAFTNQIEDPWGSYFALLDSALANPVGKVSYGDNEYFNSPQADALLGEWATATTAAARQQAEDGIEQIMVSDVPAIPLFYNVLFAEWNSSKVTGWPTSSDEYEAPTPGGEQAEVVVLHLTPAS